LTRRRRESLRRGNTAASILEDVDVVAIAMGVAAFGLLILSLKLIERI
jgi:hypothetical protein